jgi:hypothetical protein
MASQRYGSGSRSCSLHEAISEVNSLARDAEAVQRAVRALCRK